MLLLWLANPVADLVAKYREELGSMKLVNRISQDMGESQFSVHGTLHKVHGTLHKLHGTLYKVHGTLYKVRGT